MSTPIWLLAALTGLVLLAFLKKRPARYDDAAKLRIGSKRPFGHGEEGR